MAAFSRRPVFATSFPRHACTAREHRPADIRRAFDARDPHADRVGASLRAARPGHGGARTAAAPARAPGRLARVDRRLRSRARTFDASKATVYRHLRALAQSRLRAAGPGDAALHRRREALRARRAAARPLRRPRRGTPGDGQAARRAPGRRCRSARWSRSIVVLDLMHGPRSWSSPRGPARGWPCTPARTARSGWRSVRRISSRRSARRRPRPPGRRTPDPTRAAHEKGRAVRKRGWATAPNQVLLGVNTLAAPVFDHRGGWSARSPLSARRRSSRRSPRRQQLALVLEAARAYLAISAGRDR